MEELEMERGGVRISSVVERILVGLVPNFKVDVRNNPEVERMNLNAVRNSIVLVRYYMDCVRILT